MQSGRPTQHGADCAFGACSIAAFLHLLVDLLNAVVLQIRRGGSC